MKCYRMPLQETCEADVPADCPIHKNVSRRQARPHHALWPETVMRGENFQIIRTVCGIDCYLPIDIRAALEHDVFDEEQRRLNFEMTAHPGWRWPAPPSSDPTLAAYMVIGWGSVEAVVATDGNYTCKSCIKRVASLRRKGQWPC